MTRSTVPAERGVALVAAVLVLACLFVAGTAILAVSSVSHQTSRSFTGSLSALHVADAGVQHIVARQNDLTMSPRYLFNPATYQNAGANPLPDINLALISK